MTAYVKLALLAYSFFVACGCASTAVGAACEVDGDCSGDQVCGQEHTRLVEAPWQSDAYHTCTYSCRRGDDREGLLADQARCETNGGFCVWVEHSGGYCGFLVDP